MICSLGAKRLGDALSYLLQMLVQVDLLDHFFEKAKDDQSFGNGSGDASAQEIKKFLFINFARRCAVTALDLVGKNFKARHFIKLKLLWILGLGETECLLSKRKT